MTQEQNIQKPNPYAGPLPMVRIDGAKIRKLRESKGLTQLYLSTVVGVTTDTISRWENKRYQSIKLENAEKLAQALETALEDIQIQDQQTAEDADEAIQEQKEESPPASTRMRPKAAIIFGGIFSVFAVTVFIFALIPRNGKEPLSAERVLPRHAAPGQSFPVLIKVISHESEPVALIIKESLPPGTTAPEGIPAITTVDKKNNSLKWISRTATGESVYGYLCRLPAAVEMGEEAAFTGSVTLKKDAGEQEAIGGDFRLTVSPYHWADTNEDYMIDDEEILAVYDTYSDIEELRIDRDLIDNIWASNGYSWDEKSKQYTVRE